MRDAASNSDVTVYTNERGAYASLDKPGFRHGTVKHTAQEYVKGTCHINGAESCRSMLKRSIHGTWRRVSPQAPALLHRRGGIPAERGKLPDRPDRPHGGARQADPGTPTVPRRHDRRRRTVQADIDVVTVSAMAAERKSKCLHRAILNEAAFGTR